MKYPSKSSGKIPGTDSFTRRALCLALLPLGAAHQASAQVTGGDQPLRIIVATAVGGVPDLMARIIGPQITASTGRAVIVENRLGAGGIVALGALNNAPADGSSVVLIESGSYAIAPHMTNTNPFAENVTPVAPIAIGLLYLCVNVNLGVNTFRELVAYVKSKPGLPYGSSGNGSSHQLLMELLKIEAGLDMIHIPYRGAGQTVQALLAGDVGVAFLGYNSAAPQAEAGKLRILAVASAKRISTTPNIPTMEEAGGPPMDLPITVGTFANSRTPPQVIEALNRELGKAAARPEVRAKFAQVGLQSADGTVNPRQYAAMVKADFDAYGKIVRAAKLKID
jgi:tripartite-type tricarboxylate transporter receptor subunit TctC